MFRFTIRDMLWLTVLIGLALIWWQEHQHRQTRLLSLNRFQVVADEPALGGRWEIVEKTSNGKTHELGGKSAGSMMFQAPYCSERDSPDRPDFDGEYTIVGPGEIDIDMKMVPTFKAPVWKWRYQLKGGELRIIRSSRPGERPKDFDALNDPSLTLYVLKKPVVVSIEEAFKRKMMPLVGERVVVTGQLATGDIGDFIFTDEGGFVFLRATESSEIGREDDLTKSADAAKSDLVKSIGKRVTVTGILRFSTERLPPEPGVSGIDEHFYIDIAEATIRAAGPVER